MLEINYVDPNELKPANTKNSLSGNLFFVFPYAFKSKLLVHSEKQKSHLFRWLFAFVVIPLGSIMLIYQN
jgi:hypothetical protein